MTDIFQEEIPIKIFGWSAPKIQYLHNNFKWIFGGFRFSTVDLSQAKPKLDRKTSKMTRQFHGKKHAQNGQKIGLNLILCSLLRRITQRLEKTYNEPLKKVGLTPKTPLLRLSSLAAFATDIVAPNWKDFPLAFLEDDFKSREREEKISPLECRETP